GMLAAAFIPYALVERRWRWRWREVETGRIPALAGSPLYRESPSVPVFLDRAPAAVRAMAFSCLLLGQMFVPGLALGMVGLLVAGAGVVAIPGLMVAWRLYSAGLHLLRRTPRHAYWQARSAASSALWLNGIIFAITVLIAGLARPQTSAFGAPALFVNGY